MYVHDCHDINKVGARSRSPQLCIYMPPFPRMGANLRSEGGRRRSDGSPTAGRRIFHCLPLGHHTGQHLALYSSLFPSFLPTHITMHNSSGCFIKKMHVKDRCEEFEGTPATSKARLTRPPLTCVGVIFFQIMPPCRQYIFNISFAIVNFKKCANTDQIRSEGIN